LAAQNLMGCELRAMLPGYRSDAVNLSGRRMFDQPDVGTIILHRLANVEGTTISATTLMAPKDARKAYEKAREALRKGKTADAQKELDKAVTAYPQFAAAWNDLGMLHEQGKDLTQARDCYSKAVAADPKLVPPYLHLTQLWLPEKNWQQVADITARVIKLDPVDYPEAYFYNAVAEYNMGKYEAAEVSAREAQKLDTAHKYPQVQHVMGVILYQKKDYAGAADQMRQYLLLAPDAPDASQVKQQLTELERLSGGETKAKADQPQQ
jgi:tetratricopeptide (TPR) repeat protein